MTNRGEIRYSIAQMSVLWILFTAYAWMVTATAFTCHYVLFLLIRPFSKDSQWQSIKLTWPCIRAGFFLCGFRLTAEGTENLPSKGPFILVSNHQSHLDILMYLKCIPRKFAFVAKKELLQVPILGWDIQGQGHISIDRSDARGAVAELKRLEDLIVKGKSVLLFAEGTRSLDGRIGLFKKGAFVMAVHTGVPIIPCFIQGTGYILNKTSMKMRPGSVHVVIGKPQAVRQEDGPQAKGQATQLMHSAREWMLDQQKRFFEAHTQYPWGNPKHLEVPIPSPESHTPVQS